jgi:hypothetical protein
MKYSYIHGARPQCKTKGCDNEAQHEVKEEWQHGPHGDPTCLGCLIARYQHEIDLLEESKELLIEQRDRENKKR